LPLSRACDLLEVNRGSYYRVANAAQAGGAAPASASQETQSSALREAIERITLAFPA
jgi:hypothetical protein